jgi:hypothetical protein
MINYCKGRVTEVIRTYSGCTETKVSTDFGEALAINYNFLTGRIKEGDEVLLNTTAVDLGLGSGGYHFVLSINDGCEVVKNRCLNMKKSNGHTMKLRYTPLQFSFLSMEEENSPYHELFDKYKDIKGMKVIIGELHSMLLPAVFNIKRINPKIKVSYIMTDGGALPISFSRSVVFLNEKRLIEGSITFGQAFGGDYEALNIYTALLGAKHVLNSDIAIITMGPGITGTGTKYGFSGIEQGYIIDAVNTLGVTPVFIPRISFAEKRARHFGISHHSITILSEIAKTRAEVIMPRFSEQKDEYVKAQIKKHGINHKHKIVFIQEQENILNNILHFDDVMPTTMGRSIGQDKEFFITAGAAGYYCARS